LITLRGACGVHFIAGYAGGASPAPMAEKSETESQRRKPKARAGR